MHAKTSFLEVVCTLVTVCAVCQALSNHFFKNCSTERVNKYHSTLLKSILKNVNNQNQIKEQQKKKKKKKQKKKKTKKEKSSLTE